MTNPADQLARSHDLSAKVARLFQRRAQLAQERLTARLKEAAEQQRSAISAMTPWQFWQQGADYAVDFAQRAVLFWDTLRQRGNAFVEHTQAGMPPLLHFESELVMDGRTLERPVNYALLRIVPRRASP